MSLKINPFQKKKLRALGAMHSALHEKTLGLSHGISKRRADALPEAKRELTKLQRELEQASTYAERDKQYASSDAYSKLRERVADAENDVRDIDAQLETLDAQREAASADSSKSGRVFEKLLKFAEA
jgi:chromosome segregation ATPase